MKISANAKLNLCLDILGQREDGYHLLDMVMQEINLFDEIDIEKANDISVVCNIELPKRNTAFVAAEKFFEYTKIKGGSKITIKKYIPDKAGLGGGSSDAAAVIKALNEIYSANLSFESMEEIASFVGSDVPFFIKGGTARVGGVGEIIEKTENNINCFYVLAKPKGGVSTVEAYKKYHETENEACDMPSVLSSLLSGNIKDFALYAKNALENAAFLINEDVLKVKGLFYDAEFSMMTGSGSCVFGMYENKKAADAAFERISKNEIVSFCGVYQGISR